MDQLYIFLQERLTEQQQLSTSNLIRTKQQYQNKQKNRVKNQNYIIKQMSSYKNPNIQFKKSVYQATLLMMNLYSKIQQQFVEYQNNFTINYINLFVKFFNQHNQFNHTNSIKLIVRPNNCFLIVDLIRLLIDFSREKLKKLYYLTFKDQPTQEKLFPKPTLILKPHSSLKMHALTEQTKIQQPQQLEVPLNPQINSKNTLYDRFRKYIWSFNIDQLSQKINVNFNLLNQLNSNNRLIIHKYRDSCFGNKRNIAYDYSGLYTNSQRERISEELKESIVEYSNQPKLSGLCTSEQLSRNFKTLQQIQQMKEKIFKKKSSDNINSWLYLRIDQNYQKYPYTLMVVLPKEAVNINKYIQNDQKVLRQYLQQKLNQNFNEKLTYKYLNLPNFNRKKIQQLLYQERYLKKQSLLPVAKNDNSKELKQEFKSKHKSQTKLIPIIRQSCINKNNIDDNESDIKIILTQKQLHNSGYNCLTRQKHISTFHL